MSRVSQLAEDLKLPSNLTEDDVPFHLTALTTSAARDENPAITLREIHQAISQNGFQMSLEPLDLIPVLLPSQVPEAGELIALIGEFCSSKEVMLAAQEATERLASKIVSHEFEDDEVEGIRPLARQTADLVELFAAAIPRLKLRRKTAVETLQPLLELKVVISVVSLQCSHEDGRKILASAANLALQTVSWVVSLPSTDEAQADQSREILRTIMLSAISDCARHLNSQRALRSFRDAFPRLRMPSGLPPGWQEGAETIQIAIDALNNMNYDWDLGRPELSSVILLAHRDSNEAPHETLKALLSLRPILISALQTNQNLDDTLAVLVSGLSRVKGATAIPNVDEDLVVPLAAVLPALASTHPDPTIRHITYRILSLAISLATPHLRLQILRDLTSSDSDAFPQLQVAAVGLVKEALIEAFSSPSSNLGQLFLSPMFFQTFGPILFRSNPPDLFSNTDLSKEEFVKSSEPPRLIECLSLYYVLLMRDTSNKTGVRGKDIIGSIESSLLTPLRRHLNRWADEAGQEDHVHDALTLNALQMGVDRISEGMDSLGLKK